MNDYEDILSESLSDYKAFSAEQNCSVFELSFCQHQDYWGIFWKYEDYIFMVYPGEITASLLKDECLLRFNLPREPFCIEVRRHENYMEWVFQQDEHTIKTLYFSIDEYAGKIKHALKSFYRQINNVRVRTRYEHWIKEDVRNCIRKLSVKGLYRHTHRPLAEQVRTEVFYFWPSKEPYWANLRIGIGKKTFDTALDDGDCSYECIRHQLENFVFEQKTKIELGDGAHTQDDAIFIEEKCVLYNPDQDGRFRSYKPLAFVSVESCVVADTPRVIQGYCDEKQVIQTLYEGLLRFALMHDLKKKEYEFQLLRLPLYNILKSPIIENFLDRLDEPIDSEHIEDIPQIRQQNIRTILRIETDYDACLWYLSEDRPPLSAKDDCFEGLLDKHGKPMVVEGISAWQNELEPFLMAQACEEKTDFDWASYHKRGIALAKQLRAKLPDDVDLWYRAPFEDPSGIIPHEFLVRK